MASAAASDPWDDLFNAPSTITPITLLYADSSFITAPGGDVTAWSDAWAGGAAAHDASAAGNNPSWDGTDVVFDLANTESMVWDFSSAEGVGDWTIAFGMNQVSVAAQADLADWLNGRLVLATGYFGNDAYYYGSWRDSGAASVTGAQYLVYCLKNPNQGEVRRNAVSLATGLGYGSCALGGTVALGARYDRASSHADMKLRFAAIYSGVNAADTAAIEAVCASILGL